MTAADLLPGMVIEAPSLPWAIKVEGVVPRGDRFVICSEGHAFGCLEVAADEPITLRDPGSISLA